MAISLLAGGKQVPARQKPVGQADAMPVAQPSQKLEIATPAWIQPILDRIAAPVEKDDDSALAEAIAKLQQEVGPIATLKAEAARQKERADMLQALVTDLQAPPAPTPIAGGQHTEQKRINRINRDDEEVLLAVAFLLRSM